MRQMVAIAVLLIPGCSLTEPDCGAVRCDWVIHGDLRLPVQPTATRRATLRVGDTIDVSVEAIGGCFVLMSDQCSPTTVTWSSSDPAVASVTPPASVSGRTIVVARSIGAAVISAHVVGGKAAEPPAEGDAESLTITVTP